MKLKDKRLVRIWGEVADTLQGKFSMPLQAINGGSMGGGMYLFRIELDYRNVLVTIHNGYEEAVVHYGNNKANSSCGTITITAKKKTREDIELSIWRKDFMDRFFNFGLSPTGYKNFDKVIALKASRNIERYLPKVFENVSLRKDLIGDRYRVYNIQTIDNFITIQRKSQLLMQGPKMIISEYEKFCLFLDGLVNARIL